jgi:peptide deformylase
MTILDILKAPDKRLEIKSFVVDEINDEIRKLCDDMLETMYAANGIGLSAVQIGVHKRVIIIDLQEETEKPEAQKNIYYMINPEIIESSSELSRFNEGCLSFPGQQAEIIRPEKVTVKYSDYNGEEKILETEGLLATCVQHEIDHLNGIVFIDHISNLKKTMIIKKMKKAKKLNES